jgi:hypothetical protein
MARRRFSRAQGLLLLMSALLVVSCHPSATDLAATLPKDVNGRGTQVAIIGDELSGLVIDDAIRALGKSRQDAAIATAIADPDLLIVAVAVNGIGGTSLLSALESHWTIAGPTTSATVGGKAVVLKGSPGTTAYFYLRDPSVYVVETANDADAAAALASLP